MFHGLSQNGQMQSTVETNKKKNKRKYAFQQQTRLERSTASEIKGNLHFPMSFFEKLLTTSK